MIPLVPVNPGDSGMINTIYGFDYLGDAICIQQES